MASGRMRRMWCRLGVRPPAEVINDRSGGVGLTLHANTVRVGLQKCHNLNSQVGAANRSDLLICGLDERPFGLKLLKMRVHLSRNSLQLVLERLEYLSDFGRE